MNRTESRAVARSAHKSGQYKFVRIVEDFETGHTFVTAMNRCNMPRTFLSPPDLTDDLR